ncbi:hypothetical protein [Kribbella catacumbae]|uniref:hypothetical protein n=1 Tax=Kribbella catacumbae TaxID=460086 RepID=UPI0012F8D9B7|nr:hypothetical protein [Kribbella catacumbae]
MPIQPADQGLAGLTWRQKAAKPLRWLVFRNWNLNLVPSLTPEATTFQLVPTCFHEV